MKSQHPVIEYVQNVEKETLRYVDSLVQDIKVYFVRDKSGSYHGHLVCTLDRLSKFKLENPELIFYSGEELTDGERLELARAFDLPPDDDGEKGEENITDPNTSSLFKHAALMKLVGLDNASNELLRLGLLNDVKKDTLLSTVYYSHKKFKSFEGAKNASQKTHRLKKEVISVIKSTWEMYPSLSKGRMIEIIKEHYSGGVSEKTLKTWIKDNKLSPAQPKKYYSGAVSLVFPDKV